MVPEVAGSNPVNHPRQASVIFWPELFCFYAALSLFQHLLRGLYFCFAEFIPPCGNYSGMNSAKQVKIRDSFRSHLFHRYLFPDLKLNFYPFSLPPSNRLGLLMLYPIKPFRLTISGVRIKNWFSDVFDDI